MADTDVWAGVGAVLAAVVTGGYTWWSKKKKVATNSDGKNNNNGKGWDYLSSDDTYAERRKSLKYVLRRQAAYTAVAQAMMDLQEVADSPRVVLLSGILKNKEDGHMTGVVLQENTINAASKMAGVWTGHPLSPWYTTMLSGIPTGETFVLRPETIPLNELLREIYERDGVVQSEITVIARGQLAHPFKVVYVSVNRLDHRDIWAQPSNAIIREVALNTIAARWRDLY